LDTGHQYAQKEILPLSVAKLKDRLMYLHLSDNDSTKNDHFVPGNGTIDWIGLFEALKINNYQGYAGLDIAKTNEELSVSYLKAKDIFTQGGGSRKVDYFRDKQKQKLRRKNSCREK
jgi:sugar phosphate isomerase/epimerase